MRQELIGRGKVQIQQFSWASTASGYLDLMKAPGTLPFAGFAKVQSTPKMAVVIATLGRPAVVTGTLRHIIENQSLKPSTVIVSCVSSADAGEAAHLPGVQIVTGRPGLAAQRNAALAVLPDDTDAVVFFDDDFVADSGWLAAAAKVFQDEQDVVAFTGDVLADGIKGPGLSFEEAEAIISDKHQPQSWSRIEPYSPYGCNMAFRMSAIGTLRFDERLCSVWLVGSTAISAERSQGTVVA